MNHSANQPRKIVLAITGASGSIYAFKLLEKLQQLKFPPEEIAVIFSETAKEIWKAETGKNIHLKLLRRNMTIKHFMLHSHQDLLNTTL